MIFSRLSEKQVQKIKKIFDQLQIDYEVFIDQDEIKSTTKVLNEAKLFNRPEHQAYLVGVTRQDILSIEVSDDQLKKLSTGCAEKLKKLGLYLDLE